MSDLINSKILDRIRKLMSLSENNSNVNEAANAFAQAQTLLSKHRLTLAEVEAASNTLNAGEQITKSARPLYSGERVVHWKCNLATFLAKYNGCKMFVNYTTICRECDTPVKRHKLTGMWGCPKCIANLGRKKKTDYVVVGRPSDIEIVDYLFQSIVVQIEMMCKVHMMQGAGSGKTWSNNFKTGAVETVIHRIRTAHEEVRKEYQGSSAMVLVEKRDAEVQAWVQKEVGQLRSLNASPARSDHSAREMGRQAGNKVSLNKGLGGNNSSGGLLS